VVVAAVEVAGVLGADAVVVLEPFAVLPLALPAAPPAPSANA
jgi:hypothetical protein